jgi:hypothetical protein
MHSFFRFFRNESTVQVFCPMSSGGDLIDYETIRADSIGREIMTYG